MLQNIPANWRDRLILLQNELLPDDWIKYGYDNPTVISAWFEKKKGQDTKVIIPSPAYGPNAGLLETALGSIDIPVQILDDSKALLFECYAVLLPPPSPLYCLQATARPHLAHRWNHHALAAPVAYPPGQKKCIDPIPPERHGTSAGYCPCRHPAQSPADQ